MAKFYNLVHKRNVHLQAIGEGADTAEKIAEWLKERGDFKPTAAKVGQFILNNLGGQVKREWTRQGTSRMYKYRLP